MTLGTGFLAVMLREGKGGVEASYPEQGLLGEGVDPGYALSTEIPSKVGLPSGNLGGPLMMNQDGLWVHSKRTHNGIQPLFFCGPKAFRKC